MGNARYDAHDYAAYTTKSTAGKSREQIFTQRGIHPDLDPAKIAFREAVDSPANPESTPIILAADETGSMGILAEEIIRGKLGEVFKQLYDLKPVSDPQILCAGVGDAFSDVAPLQVTQFEADGVALAAQVQKIFLEGNGGGNGGESYPLVWAFAALKTKTDSYAKRGRKGYIFTIGDEAPHLPPTSSARLRKLLGIDTEPLDAAAMLRLVEREWHVFHLIVKPVYDQPVVKIWRDLLGERAIVVGEIENLVPGIIATIQVMEGQRPVSTPSTAVVVRTVTAQLVRA